MEQRIRAYDWSSTPLGPLEGWPQSLRTALKIALNSRYPIWMGWGRDLINLYNDPYIPVLGKRDEWALGASARDVWKEIWVEHLGPQADAVLLRGEASWNDQRHMVMYRNGYAEETYFTFSFSPLPADEGGIGGLFCACTEDTQKVLGERRLAALRHLAAATANARTEREAAAIAARTLSEHDADVTFALVYLIASDGATANLAAGSGAFQPDRWAPSQVSLTDEPSSTAASWPLREAMTAGTQILRDIDQSRALPGGRWPEPTTAAAVVPLVKVGHGRPRGFLVVGASPRLPFDENYESFFELLARGTADALSNARAYEEERRRAEALAELDRAKTAFFSNVSHEFRTPLTLMLGPVEDLLAKSRADLSPSTRGQLEIVNRNGLRLLRLVNSLLDFSRIEAGRVQAAYQPTDLASFTAELASSFRAATERAGLRLVVDCRPLPQPVYVDRDMWEKIVLNLLSNAFKFTFEGEIEVSIQEEAASGPPTGSGSVDGERPPNALGHQPSAVRSLSLRVRDTGVGIPAEEMPRLFERFHRVQNTRSRTHEGSGIGLALVHELVRLHGGSVTAVSKVGEGSTFCVSLPFGVSHLPADKVAVSHQWDSAALGAGPFVEEALRWLPEDVSDEELEIRGAGSESPETHRPTPDASSVTRPRVLVADDNADMRRYIARLLAERYVVEAASDGEAALAVAKARRPDLILTDVMMPKLDGFGLLRELRSDTETRTIPVIVLSARAGEESRIEGLEQGADDYLIKPFSAKELLARVAAHLNMALIRQKSEARTAADLEDMTRLYEVGNRCVRESDDLAGCLDEIVATAIAITGAGKGNLQMFDAETGLLVIAAHQGFEQRFLDFFAAVGDEGSAACSAAMRKAERVVVEDVTQSECFVGRPSLAVLLEADVRAVQSTPLMSSRGQLLGMVSTHFSAVHRPTERELRLMDLLARQAADFLERKRTEAALKKNHEQLRAHADELARFNRVAVDRELRMIELKQEVNDARRAAGLLPAYELSFTQEQQNAGSEETPV
jgi:signal transduction histidine kinase/CheY-like chemotaxis protein